MAARADVSKDNVFTDQLTVSSSEQGHEDGKAFIGIDQVLEVQGDPSFIHTTAAAPLNPWSKTSLQLYAILLTACLNATSSGFDGVCAHLKR